MADEKKFTLHYGGKEFAVPRGDLLDEVDLESPGTLKVNLGDGGWLTIAVGPGVPIAIAETVVQPTYVYT